MLGREREQADGSRIPYKGKRIIFGNEVVVSPLRLPVEVKSKAKSKSKSDPSPRPRA